MCFCCYLPLEIGIVRHFNKLLFPLSESALCQIWLEFAHAVILEKRTKLWKVYENDGNSHQQHQWQQWWYQRQQRLTTKIFQSEKLTWAFWSGELKSKEILADYKPVRIRPNHRLLVVTCCFVHHWRCITEDWIFVIEIHLKQYTF